MSQQVLHLDFIKLDAETTQEQLKALEQAAAALLAIDGVIGAGVIAAEGESDFDVAIWFLLREFAALEPFGTDPRYSRFLQGSVAPLLRAFAGADVTLRDDFETMEGPAACLALSGPEEAYDFEVRDALDAWSEAIGAVTAAVGVAVGEKQMYRGAAIAFGDETAKAEKPDIAPFRATFIRGTARALG